MNEIDSTHILEVRNLFKIYGAEAPEEALTLLRQGQSKDEIREEIGAVVGVDDASFEVKRGEFFVIMGLSGSGKSTLIRCLIRLIEPTAGELLLDGQDIAAMNEKELREVRRTKLAMVFQHYGLLPHKTVLQNVEYGLKVRGISKDERHAKARTAIERVGLAGWEDERPSSLSGGMQQRVGLARALAHEPNILLMDEPFSGLDPLIRRQMQDEFATLRAEEQITTIFVTHDLDEALRLGDRIAIMRAGQIIQIATPAELVMNPADDYVRAFVEGASAARFMTAQSIMNKDICAFTEDTSAAAALNACNEHESPVGFIIEPDGRLKGLVTARQLMRHSNDGRTPWSESIQPIVSTGPETPLEEIVPLAAETNYPVAVVDGSGKLKGAISQITLLQTLAKDFEEAVHEESDGQTDEAPEASQQSILAKSKQMVSGD